MKIAGKNIVITGAASGIGLALAHRFKAEGASGLTLADLDGAKVSLRAGELDAVGFECDVTRESDIRELVSTAERYFGPIDLFCSNAGVAFADPDPNNGAAAPDEDFQRSWQVHVMAHVYAARMLVPGMVARGSGYFLNTASAAGLLSHVNSTTYAVTKHAAVAFAEALAIRHRDQGVGVSVLCPQAVRTAMLRDAADKKPAAVDGILSAQEVAECVVRGLEAEQFLILPHPTVAEYLRRKSLDYDRWLSGMARLRKKSQHLG